MATLKARAIAALSVDELWELPETPFKIEFDNGVIETSARATIFSAYIFGPFYQQYPEMPALKEHHIGDNYLTGNTTLSMTGRMANDWHDTYGITKDQEVMWRLIYQITNNIYNDFTYRLEEYVGTLSILDFMEVLDQPQIAAINANVQPNRGSVDEAYRQIRKVLNDPKVLTNNPVSKSVRSKLVSIGQVLQCVGPRGLCTDIDSNIFRDPILVGYVQGIRSLADSMIESRSAAKSMMFTKDPLQASQYFNRKMQLLTGSFLRIHAGDCGSPHTIPMAVHSKDLDAFAGKYYIKEGKLLRFLETDKHLIDETVYMRTIFGCLHPDPQGKCATCYGDLALSIPRDTNVGHIAATSLCEVVSQKLLSVKHEDGSASSDDWTLSDFDKRYLEEGSDGNSIRLSERLEDDHVYLTVAAREADHLNDIMYVNDVKDLPVGLVSNLSEVQIKIISKKGEEPPVTLQVSDGSRKSSMSHQLLAYVKTYGWSLNAVGNYVIDLVNWNMSHQLFEMPLKQINMLDYMNMIEKFIKATDKGKQMKTLRDFETPDGALRKFYELVKSRLFVNIAHLEVIVYTVMVRSSLAKDFRMPIHGNAVEFGPYNDIMTMRSLAPAMAYERHNSVLLTPISFITEFRADHVLDAMLAG
jgi:hypothetical protein